MAKYTELFAEYLEGGGELPAAFADINGFEDLFVARFCDKEIGFETEALFRIKLEEKAELVIPAYVKLLASYNEAWAKVGNPTKTRSRTFTGGAQGASTTALPMNSVTANPSQSTQTDSYVDTDVNTEDGFTPDEALRYLEHIEKLKKEEFIILDKCLNEFNSLFMQVY